MVWLDRGETKRLDKSFAHFEAWRDEVLLQEELDFHKLGRKIAREEDWLRYGVSARRKRNVKRLGNLHSLRDQKREYVHKLGTAKMTSLDSNTSGKIVADLEGVSIAFGDRTVVDKLDLRVLRGDRLGIVGPNGAGKSTLLKLILGELAPDSGTAKLGTALEVVTLDQKRATLDPKATLADTLTGGKSDMVIIGEQSRHVIGYMKEFLFKPEQSRTPVGTLSGGERGRLLLAKALTLPSNLLVLDEPTNDLDLETLDLLEELLADYQGTVIVVSHDRDFLDRVATSVLVSEGNGKWLEYAGGYNDMLAQRGSAPGARETRAEKKAAAKAAAAAPAPAPAKKISFKELHELKNLTAEIDTLHKAIQSAEAKLATPGLFEKDPKAFTTTSATLATTQARLLAAEERWLELEMLKGG
jgi:ATP-binding cassette subfamily F protein uup